MEGLTIWTIVLKATGKIGEGQEKKDRFENKRFREFLENDVKMTEQSLKFSREIYVKIQESDFKIEELKNKVENLSKEVAVNLSEVNKVSSESGLWQRRGENRTRRVRQSDLSCRSGIR